MCKDDFGGLKTVSFNRESGFINLHLHTRDGSLLDSFSSVEEIVKRVKELNQTAVAITDHSTTHAHVKMAKESKKNSVKFIVGCEFYICEDRFVKDKDSKYDHLSVLAKNEEGRQNINKLVALAYKEGFYSKPRIDFKLLKKFSKGLIVLSGCVGSTLMKALSNDDYDNENFVIHPDGIFRAKMIAKQYREVFGDDYYLEIQAHRDDRQRRLNRQVVDIAKEMGIEYVVTSDSHYTLEEDQEIHSIFVQIGRNQDVSEIYNDCFIQSEEEALTFLQPTLTREESEIAVRNTRVIADKCNAQIPLSDPIIPTITIPKQFDNENAYFKYLINKGWVNRRINKKSQKDLQIYNERLMYEYNAITKMGFVGYFLLVHSYSNVAKYKSIARGSGGGCLIAYLLGITNIDPIPYDLYFERFIDVGGLALLEAGKITRAELKIPDFDIDFSNEDRIAIMNFLNRTYGEENVVHLGQFGYIWDKSAIKDVGRVLDIDYKITNDITKQMGNMTVREMKESSTFSKYIELYPKLFEYAEKIAGTPKSFGIHPCAVTVSNKESTYFNGVAVNNGQLVLMGDMKDAESLSLVKIDLLGLEAIKTINVSVELAEEDVEFINPNTMDYNDENVLDIYRNGQTDGLFQFESSGMKETLRKMKPNGIMDLAVANALFRPSSMKHIDHYVKRKYGEEEVEYLHDDLKEVLGETYGIFVFQEQLITLGKIGGMRNADLLRQATGKKNPEKMQQAREELFRGLKARKWNEQQLETLWEIMLDFASYSFNKSHAMAYAQTSFQMAKMKYYYPMEFMTSLLNSVKDSKVDTSRYVTECRRMGIEVVPPNLNLLNEGYIIKDGKIYFGLTAINGVGTPTIEALIELKKELRRDLILDDLVNIIDLSSIVSFIKAGALGKDKINLLNRLFKLIYTPTIFKERKTVPSKKELLKLVDDGSPFNIFTEDELSDKDFRLDMFNKVKHEQYLIKEKARYEKQQNEFNEKYITNESMFEFETMSLFITKNPFEEYLPLISSFNSKEDEQSGILIVGTLIDYEAKKTSSGQYYKLQYYHAVDGAIEGKAYGNTFKENKDLFKKGNNIVCLVKKRNNAFIIERVRSFESWLPIAKRKIEQNKQLLNDK